jgi:hypothetical protein
MRQSVPSTHPNASKMSESGAGEMATGRSASPSKRRRLGREAACQTLRMMNTTITQYASFADR